VRIKNLVNELIFLEYLGDLKLVSGAWLGFLFALGLKILYIYMCSVIIYFFHKCELNIAFLGLSRYATSSQ
jgi:hypothetical protein